MRRLTAGLACAAAAALITPTPDPVNMLIVALPLYALYELGVLLSRMFRVVPPEEDRTLLPGR